MTLGLCKDFIEWTQIYVAAMDQTKLLNQRLAEISKDAEVAVKRFPQGLAPISLGNMDINEALIEYFPFVLKGMIHQDPKKDPLFLAATLISGLVQRMQVESTTIVEIDQTTVLLKW